MCKINNMKLTLFMTCLIVIFSTGCDQKDKNVLLIDSWACPKNTVLKIWKDGYPGEVKKYKAIGCRDINGDRAGYHIAWKDYGIKEHEGAFHNDKPDDEWSYYHNNGLLQNRGFYVNGEKHGIWSHWDDKGYFLYDKKYENGVDLGRI